jgi:hypothetical protein
LRQRINPNWSAAFFVPAFILAAAWLRGAAPFKVHPGWERWSLRIGGALVLIVHLALVIIFSTDLKGIDKLASLRGWNEAGIEAQKFLDGVPEPKNTFVMALGHRYHAAEMAFYMPSHPRVYRWEPSGAVQSQYEIWPGPEERIGSDALILDPGPGTALLQNSVFTTAFEKLEHRGSIRIQLGKGACEFSVYLGRKLKQWKPVRAQ